MRTARTCQTMVSPSTNGETMNKQRSTGGDGPQRGAISRDCMILLLDLGRCPAPVDYVSATLLDALAKQKLIELYSVGEEKKQMARISSAGRRELERVQGSATSAMSSQLTEIKHKIGVKK